MTTHELAKELIGTTTTKPGLKVFTSIINRVYKTGRKVAEGFKKSMRILFDAELVQWNYVANPSIGGA